MPENLHTSTRGEMLVYSLLRKLSRKSKEFYFEAEPRLNTQDGKIGRPDFIVVSAILGVAIIEVKDWKTIKRADQRSVEIVHSDGTSDTFDNPYQTAERYAFRLNERFEERAELWEVHNSRTRLLFPWQPMVALPFISQKTIEELEQDGIWQRGTVIGREKLLNERVFEQALRNLPWIFRLKDKMSMDMLDIIRGVINPERVITDNDQDAGKTLTMLQENLINEPVQILEPQANPLFDDEETRPSESNTQVRLVRGVAGSGKTLVLFKRAQKIVERYHDLNPRVLVLAFNQDIASDLRRRIGLPDSSVHVVHFHKLCNEICGKAWGDLIRTETWIQEHAAEELAQVQLSARFLASEFAWREENQLVNDTDYIAADRRGRSLPLDQTRRSLVNQIFNRYREYKHAHKKMDWDDVSFFTVRALENQPAHPVYDTILVDEAQDFTPSWMQVVKLLLKPGGALFICDDPSQSIFQSYSWAKKGIAVSGFTRILRIPFRSTQEISVAAHGLFTLDSETIDDEERPKPDFFTYELRSGTKPQLICRTNDTSEIKYITRAVEDCLDEMPANQIAILCADHEMTRLWASLDKRGVYVRSFDRMKGMEFTAVFVPFLHRLFSSDDEPDTLQEQLRKVFTSMTRARDQLTMTYQGDLPRALEPLVEHTWHRDRGWQRLDD